MTNRSFRNEIFALIECCRICADYNSVPVDLRAGLQITEYHALKVREFVARKYNTKGSQKSAFCVALAIICRYDGMISHFMNKPFRLFVLKGYPISLTRQVFSLLAALTKRLWYTTLDKIVKAKQRAGIVGYQIDYTLSVFIN
ncbi:hypothetical protein TcasGA2_TC010112 [Tribolium castaneum]|uniref:Uncharacterized protein n=1 Tax=Tribolium castaneum TaxID=7070 RepID=D6WSL3_TRICA|nr:hypothetical protein TcasGA2_TC010112 [Tribolium castaneum]